MNEWTNERTKKKKEKKNKLKKKDFVCTFSQKENKYLTILKCLIQGFMCNLNPNQRPRRSKTILTFAQS